MNSDLKERLELARIEIAREQARTDEGLPTDWPLIVGTSVGVVVALVLAAKLCLQGGI